MSSQPEALRLAAIFDGYLPTYNYEQVATDAAAELRRLYAENIVDQSVTAVWRRRARRAEQQRDELLAALKEATTAFEIAANDGGVNFYHYAREFRALIDQIETQ